MKTLALLPARNEATRIAKVISDIKRMRCVNKILVVDDGSTDETAKTASRLGAHVLSLRNNEGVGSATRIGIKEAKKDNPDVLVILDADGQHDPNYIPKFISEIKSGADFAIGIRDLYNYPIVKRLGNFMLRKLAYLLCPTPILDPECGFKAMSRSAIKKLQLNAKKYDICMDFIYNVWKLKLRTSQIKISVPVYHKKKGTKVRTGVANFLHLLNRRIFG